MKLHGNDYIILNYMKKIGACVTILMNIVKDYELDANSMKLLIDADLITEIK